MKLIVIIINIVVVFPDRFSFRGIVYDIFRRTCVCVWESAVRDTAVTSVLVPRSDFHLILGSCVPVAVAGCGKVEINAAGNICFIKLATAFVRAFSRRT